MYIAVPVGKTSNLCAKQFILLRGNPGIIQPHICDSAPAVYKYVKENKSLPTRSNLLYFFPEEWQVFFHWLAVAACTQEL
jgi:hypothetical protein